MQETTVTFNFEGFMQNNWPFNIHTDDSTSLVPSSEFTQAELQSLRSFLKGSIREDEGFISAINSDMNYFWERAIPDTLAGEEAFIDYSNLRVLKHKMKRQLKTKAALQAKIRSQLSSKF